MIGIPFNKDMAQANLEGIKTQTRRPIAKARYSLLDGEQASQQTIDALGMQWSKGYFGHSPLNGRTVFIVPDLNHESHVLTPYFDIGLEFYQQEPWSFGWCPNNPFGIASFSHPASAHGEPEHILHQKANSEATDWAHIWEFRVPDTLPYWANRFTGQITSIHGQFVQDVNGQDARAEGMPQRPLEGSVNGVPAEVLFFDPIDWFARCWNSIYGESKKLGWKWNPPVWAFNYISLS